MTDKEYVSKMCAFLRELNRLDPINDDDVDIWHSIMDGILALNCTWLRCRRYRLWHTYVNLAVLFLLLFLIVFTVLC